MKIGREKSEELLVPPSFQVVATGDDFKPDMYATIRKILIRRIRIDLELPPTKRGSRQRMK